MRTSRLLASLAILAAAPGVVRASPESAAPAPVRQQTGDSWDIGATSLKAPCERIITGVAFAVPQDVKPRAEAVLQNVSAAAISEDQAAALMGRPSTGHIFADLLIEEVNKIQAQKKTTVDDQLMAHDLIQAVGPHYPPYLPYLVRGLAGSGTVPANFALKLCGDTLLVDNTSAGDKASRAPLVVFLQSKATSAIPSWYVGGK